MSYQQLLKKLQTHSEEVKSVITRLQIKWGKEISLLGDFKNPIETIYDCYPYLFKDLFPNIKIADLRQLAVAGRLFSASIILIDRFLDDRNFEKSPHKVFSPLIMQWEGRSILNELFTAKSTFWQRFDSFYQKHIEACSIEVDFQNGKLEWKEYQKETALKIAVGKNGISKAVIAGLVELSGNENIYNPLIVAVDNFNIACQVLDDLLDWRQDIKNVTPSYLLIQSFDSHADFLEKARTTSLEDIAKIIYYKGHAQQTLTIALDSTETSLRILESVGGQDTDWHSLVLATKGKIESLIEDFEAIVKQNIRRIQTQPKLEITSTTDTSKVKTLAYKSLNFVLAQWRKGFGEARHIMNLSQAEGFAGSKNSEYRYGDVFQRALILEILCSVQSQLNINIDPLVEYEVNYLLHKRRTDKIGGWAYFPDVNEIAADADDLGQIIQCFSLANRKELNLTYCERAIKTLIQNNLLNDGSIETWIVPKDNRNEIQEIQHQHNTTKWGVGPDTEVVANFFYGLAVYDPQRFHKLINNAVNFIKSAQNADGSWTSRWYYGLFYGTYVSTRLLSHVNPNSSALRSAREFLINSQNENGGWGTNQSDQLSTAFALLSLSDCPNVDQSNIEAGIDFLVNSLSHNWELVEFIKPKLSEPYKSQTITAAYVCKAATTWKHLLD